MIFEKSFISFVLFVTFAAIYIKDYNEVEANSTILEKLTFKRVKQDFRCAKVKRRKRIPTSSRPNQIISSVLTVTQQGIIYQSHKQTLPNYQQPLLSSTTILINYHYSF